MITEEGLRQIRDQINEILDEQQDRTWPYDEMVVPMNPDEMNEEDWDDADKVRYTPPYGLRFRMPDPMNDFSCHECGGDYGPWIHRKMFHHGVFNRSIGEVRVRRCEDCGHVHYNSYSIGKYSVEKRDDNTCLRLSSDD